MNTPPVLLPYQQAWVADKAEVAVWEKSRRIGASWTDACDSSLTAASADEGMDVLYIGYSQDMTREYIDDCAMWAKAFNLAAGEVDETVYEDDNEDKAIKAFRIDFASGNKILALSSRPRSIRGKQGKVTIDEAAFHDDLDGLLTAALALLIWGGRVRLLSSHNGDEHPFNLLIKDVRAGKFNYSLHKTAFQDALDGGLYDRVKLKLGDRMKEQSREEWSAMIYSLYGDRAAEELDCIPRAGSGAYFNRLIIEQCQEPGIPIIKWEGPKNFVLDPNRLARCQDWIADNLKPVVDNLPNFRSVYGQDFARDGDLSVIWVLQQVHPQQWRQAFGVELRAMPFDVQAVIRDWILDNIPLFHHAKFDARGNGQSHAEGALQKFGETRIDCVKATVEWYAIWFPKYKAAYEGKNIIVAASEDIIADHRRVILVKGRPTMDDGRDKGSDGKLRHGDSAIAGLMAWAAAMTEGQPAAGETVGTKADVKAAFAVNRKSRLLH